ncbi:MAG: ribosomal RNA small subunit methyltransferase A [Caldimicrobium sp.]|nr:ribosomal RNA small subunit methyltransferase A [Caldimicrobium sp.]
MKPRPRLKKRFGQHLLVSSGVLSKIAEFAEISSADPIVEIGPGTGNLTEEVLKRNPRKLYLLEIDDEMVAYLKERFRYEIQEEKVILLKADAGKFDYSLILEAEFKVLGNLPYNRASLIVERMVYYFQKIPLAVFMVQKEVAERWMGVESWLSVFIQTFYDIEYMMTVPPRFFVPQPKVDSAVIRLKRKPKVEAVDLKDYKGFLVKLFANRRKALRSKLPSDLLERANISPLARAEELSAEDFMRLYSLLRFGKLNLP